MCMSIYLCNSSSNFGRSVGLTLFQFSKRGENVIEEQFSVADGMGE